MYIKHVLQYHKSRIEGRRARGWSYRIFLIIAHIPKRLRFILFQIIRLIWIIKNLLLQLSFDGDKVGIDQSLSIAFDQEC